MHPSPCAERGAPTQSGRGEVFGLYPLSTHTPPPERRDSTLHLARLRSVVTPTSRQISTRGVSHMIKRARLVSLGFLGLAAVFIALAIACGGASLDAATVEVTDEVSVRDSKFVARSIEVPAGTTVTWRWEGDAKHNVA